MPSAANPQSPESILLSGQGGFFTRSSGSLPGDMLEGARVRVRTACLVIAGLWFYVASAWSEDMAQAWCAENMTDALARDTKARDNGEPEPTTLTA
jgi:hypothetical protein